MHTWKTSLLAFVFVCGSSSAARGGNERGRSIHNEDFLKEILYERRLKGKATPAPSEATPEAPAPSPSDVDPCADRGNKNQCETDDGLCFYLQGGPCVSINAGPGVEGDACQAQLASDGPGNQDKVYIEVFGQGCSAGFTCNVAGDDNADVEGVTLNGVCESEACIGKKVPGNCNGNNVNNPECNAETERVTICHRTCSPTNPWVRITIDEDAWDGEGCGHQQHDVEEDCANRAPWTEWGDNRQDYLLIRHGTRDSQTNAYWKIWERACPFVRNGQCCEIGSTDNPCCGDDTITTPDQTTAPPPAPDTTATPPPDTTAPPPPDTTAPPPPDTTAPPPPDTTAPPPPPDCEANDFLNPGSDHCPADSGVTVLKVQGTTPTSNDADVFWGITELDGSSIRLRIRNPFDTEMTVYVQYREPIDDVSRFRCDSFDLGDCEDNSSTEIEVSCFHGQETPNSLIQVYFVDPTDANPDVFGPVEVAQCCHAEDPVPTSVAQYSILLRCLCPFEFNPARALRGAQDVEGIPLV